MVIGRLLACPGRGSPGQQAAASFPLLMKFQLKDAIMLIANSEFWNDC